MAAYTPERLPWWYRAWTRKGRPWHCLWAILLLAAGVSPAAVGSSQGGRVIAAPVIAAVADPHPATATVAACLDAAAMRYSLPPLLLRAIAEVESGGNPRAISPLNRDGSRDIGLMQINSRWLPKLATWRIDEPALLDPCVSAHVGAWILADNISRHGPVWRAVGAYNARTPSLQLRYALKVRQAMHRMGSNPGGATPARGLHPP